MHADVGAYVLATVQEEIGSRGAQTAAYDLAPHTALAVDMGVAMVFPQARPEEQGRLDLGKWPVICQGPNTNPVVFDILQRAADELGIPYQLQAYGDKSVTDARLLQTNRGGVATGSLAVPLRYIHTPSEVICLDDILATIDLFFAYVRRIGPDTDFTPM